MRKILDDLIYKSFNQLNEINNDKIKKILACQSKKSDQNEEDTRSIKQPV